MAYAMCDRGVQQLRRDEVLALLEQMRAEYPNVHLARSRPAEEFLSRLEARTAILVEAGHTRHLGMEVSVYEFRHLTFQEYLAARALVDGRFPGRNPAKSLADHVAPLAGRTTEATFVELRRQESAVTESWHQVLRLCITTCQDSDVDNVLRAILSPLEGEPPENARARAILAALCVADEPNVSETVVQEIFHAFAGQVSERDGTGSLQTGANMAGSEVAGTLWTAALRRALAEEFCRRESRVRHNPGGLLAMVTTAAVPLTGETLIAWLEEQVRVLRNGTEMEAIESALGIMELAHAGKAQIVPGLVTGLLDRLAESAPMAHAAAWALFWLHGMFWKPAETEIALLIRFIQDSRSDPGGVRFISWIMGQEKVEGAVKPLITWLEHADADVRSAAVKALGRIGSESAVKPLMARLEDTDANMRRAILGALAQGLEEAKRRMLSRDLDGLDPFLDPGQAITEEFANQAAQELEMPVEEIKAQYEALAARFRLRLAWQAKPTSTQA